MKTESELKNRYEVLLQEYGFVKEKEYGVPAITLYAKLHNGKRHTAEVSVEGEQTGVYYNILDPDASGTGWVEESGVDLDCWSEDELLDVLGVVFKEEVGS